MVTAPTADPQQAQAAALAERVRTARRWIAELEISEKAQAKYLTKAKKIRKLYAKEGSETASKRQYAMLWSNTQTLLPAMYSRPPQPVVTRRFKDADPVGRVASECLERSLVYSVDKQDMDGLLRTCASDFALIARAQAWERYVPTHGDEVIPEIPVVQVTDAAGECVGYRDEATGTEYQPEDIEERDGQHYAKGEAYRPVVYEESVTDFVALEDFGFGVARTWPEVPFVWRRVYMDRGQLKKRFGEDIGGRVPLDWGAKSTSKATGADTDLTKKAAIYEIWDKASKTVFWISKAFAEGPLDQRPDPLGLDGFFPCPRPLLGTTTTDSLMPTPDYVYYQDQAEEIDDLTAKIAELQSALKVVGMYAGSAKSTLTTLMRAKNLDMIPVADWESLKDNGGAKGNVDWFPVEMVVSALQACIELRRQLIEDVYQITGVSDILRGASDPRTTATAEQTKAQWGALRIRVRQNELARFARDIIRLKAEVIAEHFSIETLSKMTGLKLLTKEQKVQLQAQLQAQAAQAAQMQAAQPPQPGAQMNPAMGHNGGPPMDVPPDLQRMLEAPSWEDVQALLKDNASRQFRIDIETDSTIEADEQGEKQQTTELLTALSAFIQSWGPIVGASPEVAPLAGELLKYAVRRFRAGRELEDVIERVISQLTAKPPAQQGEAPPAGKSPEEVQMDGMAKMTSAQAAQLRAQAAMRDAQTREVQTQADYAIEQGKLAIAAQKQRADAVAMSRDPNPQSVS